MNNQVSDSQMNWNNEFADNFGEIFLILDQDFRLVFLNSAWEQVTSTPISSSLGQPLQNFIHPEDQGLLTTLKAQLHSKSPIRAKLRLALSAERTFWLSMSLHKSLPNSPTHQEFMTGSLIDISELFKIDQNWNSNLERNSLLASATTDGFWDWNLKTDEVYFCPRWKWMIGYEDHELDNHFLTWYDRVHPDDIDTCMQTVKECLDGKLPFYENIHRLRNKNNTWTWIFDRGTVLRDASGQPYRMIGTHSDITLLKKTERTLQEREAELEAIFNLSPDGIITINESGFVQSVNPAFIDMTGIKLKKLIGLSETDLNTYLDKICDCTSGPSEDNLTSHPDIPKKYVINKKKPPKKLPTSNSHSKTIISPKNLIILSRTDRYLNDKKTLKLIYFRNVTIEAELATIKNEFLASAAHELRSPITSVYGFAELLLSHDYDKETRQEILTLIHDQSATLVSMISQLLDLARIEAKAGTDLHLEKLPLRALVNQIILGIRINYPDREIILHEPKTELSVFADEDKIKQAISNILINALKFSTNTPVDVQLKLRKKSGIAQIGISIQDYGIGMDSTEVNQVFKRFWRANKSTVTGTGLGMSLVKEIMDLHHGEISIKSSSGQGTTVTLWLLQY
jgi:PAS domain S-box-containing protein